MPRTLYLHAHGRKIAQVKDGVRTDYLTDALGSITATKNQSQAIVNTYRWKPYGGMLARTGLEADDPKYGWAGDTGSRITKTNWVNQYNVLRHYGTQQAAWTTVDPLWPKEWAYGYSNGKPTNHIDVIGLSGKSAQEIFRECIRKHGRKACHFCVDQLEFLITIGVVTGDPALVSKLRKDCGPRPIKVRPKPKPIRQTLPPGKMPPQWPAPNDCNPQFPVFDEICTYTVGSLWCFACLFGLENDLKRIEDNAVRHCVLGCLAVKKCGCICATRIDEKEIKDRLTGKDLEDSACDLVNNGIGRGLGERYPDEDCASVCWDRKRWNTLCEVSER